MSMRQLENALLRELREITKTPKLRLTDIMEWSTGNVVTGPGETLVYLPGFMINCAVLTQALETKKKKGV